MWWVCTACDLTCSWKRITRAPSHHGRNRRRAINTASQGVAPLLSACEPEKAGRFWRKPWFMALSPRIRTPRWSKRVTSLGTQAEVCVPQREARKGRQQLYFLTLSAMEARHQNPKETNTLTVLDSRAAVNWRHGSLAEVRLVIQQVAQHSTPSLLWGYLFKCRFNIGLSNPFSAFFGEGLIQHAKKLSSRNPPHLFRNVISPIYPSAPDVRYCAQLHPFTRGDGGLVWFWEVSQMMWTYFYYFSNPHSYLPD